MSEHITPPHPAPHVTPVAPLDAAGLQPTAVWRHFDTLCCIPRPSKHEGPLREHLRQWALQQGLEATVDPAGNLLVRKPASPGCEHAPGVVLQGHLDMVCQKNAASPHDFYTDPIRPVLRDGWMVAEDTTLGADNGIGVALILAALQDTALVHGPLEALFTVDEEAGMGGAQGLQPGVLQGRLMLNLDTEVWGEFYLGCAGGLDIHVERPGRAEPLPPGHELLRIELGGLRGGHSGVDIHEERGNAIKLLVRVLGDWERRHGLRLATLQGGTARNALPREAVAQAAVPAGQGAALRGDAARWQALLAQELAGVESSLALAVRRDDAAVQAVMSTEDQSVWLDTLHAAPHGVRRMSRRVAGVVETSNNLGMIDLTPERGTCNFMVRSLLDTGSQALAEDIARLFALSGTPVQISGRYPGWTPNPDSPLLALCRSVYQREFSAVSTVQVIHAGLECGLIAERYPDMDIVSFGPTIRGAHAPGESVEIASVARTWQLLAAILAEASGIGRSGHGAPMT